MTTLRVNSLTLGDRFILLSPHPQELPAPVGRRGQFTREGVKTGGSSHNNNDNNNSEPPSLPGFCLRGFLRSTPPRALPLKHIDWFWGSASVFVGGACPQLRV